MAQLAWKQSMVILCSKIDRAIKLSEEAKAILLDSTMVEEIPNEIMSEIFLLMDTLDEQVSSYVLTVKFEDRVQKNFFF